MGSLFTAMQGLINTMDTIDGMVIPIGNKMAPTSADDYPFATCYPYSGNMDIEATFGKSIHVLKLLVFTNKSDQPADIEVVALLWESVQSALTSDPTLGGNVTTILAGRPITYLFGEIEYGGTKYLGFEIDLPCKILA